MVCVCVSLVVYRYPQHAVQYTRLLDLVVRMLSPGPEERLKPHQALRHFFFRPDARHQSTNTNVTLSSASAVCIYIYIYM